MEMISLDVRNLDSNMKIRQHKWTKRKTSENGYKYNSASPRKPVKFQVKRVNIKYLFFTIRDSKYMILFRSIHFIKLHERNLSITQRKEQRMPHQSQKQH